MGPKAKKAIPLLSPALSDPRKGFKISVALTLVAIDPTIPGLAEALADALERKDQSDVLEAYLLIGNPARETLLGELRSSNTKRQLGAAIALAHIDPSVKEGIPILAENLEDRFVSEAISKMGAAAVPSLVQALNNRSRRNGAVNALGLIGSQARQAMPWLLGYVVHGFFQKGDGDVQFRDHVVEAILRIDRLSLGVLWNYPQLQTLAEQALAHMHVLDERAFATRNRVDNDAGTTNPITASP